MSTLRDMAAGDVSMFQDELGDTVSLTPSGAAARNIVAIPVGADGTGGAEEDGSQVVHRRTWLIDPADLASPSDRVDTVTEAGVIYTLNNHSREGSFWRCEFTATENIQRSGERLHA